VTGRRNARLASVETIVRAHGVSSWDAAGVHESTARRLGVSVAGTASNGPSIVTWPTWG